MGCRVTRPKVRFLRSYKAALRELGAADHNALSRLADNSPAIKTVVIKHGVARMLGRTKNVTWKHVLTLARQFARA